MSGYSFDTNIVIDALLGIANARLEIDRALRNTEIWISRMAWVEVLSKGTVNEIEDARDFLSGFGIDEVTPEVADRAAALRRERPRLKSPDAIILASAQANGRVLVTRNTKDFPAAMPGIRVPYTL